MEDLQDLQLDTVYITSLYKIQSNSNIEGLQELFIPFLTLNIPIIIFTDIESLHYDNEFITCIYLPRSNLISFTQKTAKLPEYRNNEKDTLEFLQLMNAKPEFLYRATKLKPAKNYVWFDFGILKIIKNQSKFLETMKVLDRYAIDNKIVIPGCLPKNSVNLNTLFIFPIWRFCGGLFIASSKIIERFYYLNLTELKKCFELQSLTWEVNIWASIENKHSELFSWYSGDHNDTILPQEIKVKDTPVLLNNKKKLILLTMIKNESRAIRRCLDAARSICDAICICDTGSTDNTLEIISEYLEHSQVPGKVYNHEWKNFGHNRSLSFLACVDYCKELGWDLDSTYGVLIDADMILCRGPKFSKDELIHEGYTLIQKSPGVEYSNVRLVRLGFNWKCLGVTHEYWDGYNPCFLPIDFAYINDVGDGGCKDDKFIRDVKLLEAGLQEEPKNERYLFYLAQSYKDSGNIDKSIEFYNKRITAGGWYEEIWYSMYTLMKLYAEKKDAPMVEMWGQKAYEYRKERVENILYLVRFFLDKRQYFKAWHYWTLGNGTPKPPDLLFIEPEAYTYGFDKELIILHNYVMPHKKKDILEHTIRYFNTYKDGWSYSNLKWFVEKLPIKKHEIEFQPIGDFTPTSTSFCRQEDGKYRVNVRYVNYRIQPDGSYMMFENGILNRNHAVRTINYECIMDSKFNIVSPLQLMNIEDIPKHASHIKGLEDVRIFMKENQLHYIATTLEYSYNGKIRQHTGKYSIQNHRFENNRSIKPPSETDCEKNWIPYKENKIIYKWHPFQIGSISNDSDTLVIESNQETPWFFSNMRGSSTLVEEGEYLWGITHIVIYEQPRKYYHIIVKIDPTTDKLIAYTNPFYFVNNSIEYCLGLEKRGEVFYSFISQNDANPIFVEWNESDLIWKTIHI
uniref:Glycosyltransferase 2-like domain-containing protein n=1 Tax=viral metagenome TaxID=1070528 RepID=A0A6C0HEQ7_9ZZZZ